MKPTYPFGVIDYESSGLADGTYPIEIGIAIRDGHGEPIRSWSSLIRPEFRWLQDGVWDERAQAIHGITQAQLETAPPLSQIARSAMQFAGNVPLYYDGAEYDEKWHRQATSIQPGFNLKMRRIGDITNIKTYLAEIKAQTTEHRAESDAIQILRTIERLEGLD